MRVVVFGASGGVGGHLVNHAIAAGHEVTAVSRSPVAGATRTIVGDVNAPGVIEGAIAGQDAVLSALGIRRQNHANPFSPLASPADFTEATARRIVAACRDHGVPRVLAVSAAGVGDSRPGLNAMMRVMIAWTNVGANYRDLERMERVYADSGLDWTCVRPTGLKHGAATRRVDLADRFAFNAWISKADVAAWMVDHLAAPSPSRTPILTEARA